VSATPGSRNRRLLTVACALGGSLLFAYVVRRAGVSEIIDGIQRVGWGLLAILAIAGLRFALRAQCWRWCMPPAAQVSFGQALSAFLAGDAMGSVTPLGLLASEPTKVFLTRHHLATRESVASLAAENLIYGASVVAFIGIGLVVVLATVPLPQGWLWAAWISLAAVSAGAFVAARALRGTWDPSRGPRPAWRERLAAIRQTIIGFSTGHPERLWGAFAFDMGFHGLGILEVFLTLRWLLGDRSPTLVQAMAFEALNRAVTVAFKFVPFRIGIDEALSGAVAPALAVNPAAGVALAVVRKVRNVFWTGIGLAVVTVHPAKTR
jgi:hypothetical protein